MKIADFLSKKAVTADLKAAKKEDVLKELVDLLAVSEDIEKKAAINWLNSLWPERP